MIILAGRLTVNPDVMDAYAQDVANMIDKVRAEDGCIYYSLLIEDAAKGWVNVTEMWRDDAALQVHFGQSWIVDFFTKHGPSVTGSTLKVYDVAGVRDIPS